MPTILKATPDWRKAVSSSALRADSAARKSPVDRENNRLNGYVVAQEGMFKTPGRGQFDRKSLQTMIDLMKANNGGTKSRFTHPTLSADGLGKFLGRAKDPWMSSVMVERDGQMVKLAAVRANLYFDQTALEEPIGGGKPLGQYIMDLADSDSDALSSSVVIQADEEMVCDPKTKKQMYDEKSGEPVAPIWRPTRIHASDLCDTGDAVDGLLAAELSIAGLPDELVRQASELLNQAFPGQPRDVVRARLNTWLDSYLEFRFGEEEELSIEETPVVLGGISLTEVRYGLSRDVVALRTRIAESSLGIEALTVPGDPPGGSGQAVEGEWSKPTLGDFTDKSWDELSQGARAAIGRYFGWYANLDSFSGLKLPHHFPKGPNKGKASLNGVRNALARLNQTQGPSAAEKVKIKAHLEAHMPSDNDADD